jgi:hypothetical protein
LLREYSFTEMCVQIFTGVRSEVPMVLNDEIFSLRHRVQTGSGAHPASYPTGTGDYYSKDKAAGE